MPGKIRIINSEWKPEGTFCRITNPPRKESGAIRQKYWKFECPYCKSPVTGIGGLYNHLITDKHQKNFIKFMNDIENKNSKYFSQPKVTIGHYKWTPGEGARIRQITIPKAFAKKITARLHTGNHTNWCFNADGLAKRIYEDKTWPIIEVGYKGTKKTGDYIIYKAGQSKYRERYAVNVISRWFLDKRYNPKFKYCRDKQWEDFQEIFEDE
jgi:hypothetical protein